MGSGFVIFLIVLIALVILGAMATSGESNIGEDSSSIASAIEPAPPAV